MPKTDTALLDLHAYRRVHVFLLIFQFLAPTNDRTDASESHEIVLRLCFPEIAFIFVIICL